MYRKPLLLGIAVVAALMGLAGLPSAKAADTARSYMPA